MVGGDSLTDAELDYIRGASRDWMPTQALIVRNGGAVNAIGGRTEAWGTIGTVTCRIYPGGIGGAAGNEAERQDVIAADSEWVIVVPHDTDVTVKDRVEVAGATYSVTDTDDGRSSNADRRCRAVRRD